MIESHNAGLEGLECEGGQCASDALDVQNIIIDKFADVISIWHIYFCQQIKFTACRIEL